MPTGTLERHRFVEGLFDELESLIHRHLQLVGELSDVMGRLEVIERAVQLSRDHLLATLEQTDEELPRNWRKVLDQVRFVGMGTAAACLTVLQEHNKLSSDELIDALNEGNYRFRTPYPMREINAALMRHPNVRRDEEGNWVYEEKEEVRKPRTLKAS